MKMIYAVLFSLSMMCMASTAECIGLSGSGTSWLLEITESDFDMDSGFAPQYENDVDLSLTISKTKKKTPWKVTVNRIDVNWSSDLVLSIRRIDGGQAGLSGGMNYMVITDMVKDFFYGTGGIDADNVYIQYMLEGISEKIFPGTYLTNVSNVVLEL